MKAVARRTALMKTGWGLRTILEEVMLALMSEVPALSGVESLVITEEVIAGSDSRRSSPETPLRGTNDP